MLIEDIEYNKRVKKALLEGNLPEKIVSKIIKKIEQEEAVDSKELFLRRCYKHNICKDCGADTVTKWIPTHPYDEKIPFLQRRKSGQKYRRKYGGEEAVEVCPECGSELSRDDFYKR